MSWRRHYDPFDGRTQPDVEQLLARVATEPAAMRVARVSAWCSERGRWFWTDVPQCWHETFTYDLWTLAALCELEVEVRSAVDPRSGFATTEYHVCGDPLQLCLDDLLRA